MTPREEQKALTSRFNELADTWERETYFLSNSERAGRHPAHREIISMGQEVVPLILKRMETQGGHWFTALRELTGAQPIPQEDRGRIRNMQAHWLNWGPGARTDIGGKVSRYTGHRADAAQHDPPSNPWKKTP